MQEASTAVHCYVDTQSKDDISEAGAVPTGVLCTHRVAGHLVYFVVSIPRQISDQLKVNFHDNFDLWFDLCFFFKPNPLFPQSYLSGRNEIN
jgi:hypothetical protein